jgi:hypothetical protein
VSYGATYADVERELLGFGPLDAYASAISVWLADAAQVVDEALVGVGYDPTEVAARDPSDSLYRLCNRACALRAAAHMVPSLNLQDTTIAQGLFARSQEMVERIKKTPYQVSPDTWDTTKQTGGIRVARKRKSSDKPFWTPGRKL